MNQYKKTKNPKQDSPAFAQGTSSIQKILNRASEPAESIEIFQIYIDFHILLVKKNENFYLL